MRRDRFVITKYLAILALLLALAPSARASTLIFAQQDAGVSGTSLTITVPTYKVGDVLVLCVTTENGAAVTPSAGGWSAVTGTGLPIAGTYWSGCWTRTAGSEPANYVSTWTGSTSAHGSIETIRNTDGSTPVVDIAAGATTNSATNLNAASVTTTQNADLLIHHVFVVDSITPTPVDVAKIPLASATAAIETIWYAGQEIAGATPTTNFATGHSDAENIITIAIKANATTASLFVGVGPEIINGGSASSVYPFSPTNVSANDALIAAVVEGTNTGIAITAPPVVGVRKCTFYSGGATSSMSITTPAGTVQGDMLVAGIYSVGNPSGGTIVSNFTQQTRTTAVNVYTTYSLLLSGAPAASYTATIAGNNLFVGMLCSVFDSSGGTLAIGNTQTLTNSSGGMSQAGARVTTANNNALILNFWQQGTASATITPPSTQYTTVQDNTGAQAAGFFNLHTAGLTATQTATSNTSANWNTVELEVYSPTGAALSGSTAWTQIASVVEPGNTVQLNAYRMVATTVDAAGPSLFSFASNPGASDAAIMAFGNLNTTTPVDVSVTLGNAGGGGVITSPAITPTNKDELLAYLLSPSVGIGTSILNTNNNSPRLGVGYNPAALNGIQTGSPANNNAFVSMTLGLQAATAPATGAGVWFVRSDDVHYIGWEH